MIDAALLSRLQFAANITFHIIFPSITIGLSWILLFFKLKFHTSNNPLWMDAYQFWVKPFAICFALGVVSGITMSFQFGTNWPIFMETVGNIAGPLLGYEVLTAFFLEATFLGIMLFGIKRVSNSFHTLSTFFVAFGTTLSAFWIISLNSWMQTPTGFVMVDDIAHAINWFDVVFNPSFLYRFTHTIIASLITASFFVAGISAYKTLLNQNKMYIIKSFKIAVTIAAILTPLQVLIGDLHGLNTLKHQPEKIAAMEGLWKTQTKAPLVLFGIPNKITKQNDYALEIPGGASLILKHDQNAELKGIDHFGENHPPVLQVFFSFRIMVGLGLLMLAVSWIGFYCIRKQKIPIPLLLTFKWMTFSGVIATIAGWYVTEIGRQPWLVYNVLKTQNAVANLTPTTVGISLITYMVLYLFLLTMFIKTIFYVAKTYE